ncbi:MAG: hypothetical protein NTW48_01555, partial [Chloroflexi bacterium]|nr:hypothetical protein [Chloroflexota bacterium]
DDLLFYNRQRARNLKKLIWLVFWALVGDFIVIAMNCSIPAIAQWSLTFGVFMPILVFVLFFLLGIVLLVLTLKSKMTGLLRKFLILTGAIPIAIPITFVLLEFLPETVANCIFYTILLTFLAGAIGSIVLVYRFGSKQE